MGNDAFPSLADSCAVAKGVTLDIGIQVLVSRDLRTAGAFFTRLGRYGGPLAARTPDQERHSVC
jgi:hypothetical protein